MTIPLSWTKEVNSTQTWLTTRQKLNQKLFVCPQPLCDGSGSQLDFFFFLVHMFFFFFFLNVATKIDVKQ